MAAARGRRWLCLVSSSALLLLAGCASFEPMAMPDERENPTFSGLFTGPEGAWVIYRKEE